VNAARIGFLDLLDDVYASAPCQVLPHALWKTRPALDPASCDCSAKLENGQVTRLIARGGSALSLFWTRDRAEVVPAALLGDLTMALLHADYASPHLRSAFGRGEQYFRLLHRGGALPEPAFPPGFHVAPVVLPAEAAEAAVLIGRCYADLKPSAHTVESWMHHPTFSSDLWIWIVDGSTGTPAALGIAELDARIGEGSLEWVQVLPEYRGRGLGTALILTLLRRLHDRSAFVTVSGQVDNVSHPEALYRRCGFHGQDTWWVLSR
jgi:ribosomal protein S18 acetylase RimI-like enzyme